MSVLQRKLCADCGEASLEHDHTCWACGGARFAGPGDAFAGDRTISLGVAAEPTMSWAVDRRPPVGLWYVLGGVSAAFFMCMVGFWLGRASAPERVAARPVVRLSNPVPLPNPPTGLSRPDPASATVGVAPAPTPSYPAPPRVTVRSSPLVPPAAPPAQGGTFVLPPTVVYRPRPVPAQRRFRPAPVDSFSAPIVPAPPLPAPTPSRTTATLMVRNDTAFQVEIRLDGPGAQTARIAAASTIPMILTPGSYRVRASGGGDSSSSSSLDISANNTYSLVVDRARDGGKDSLLLIEPTNG